MNPEEVKNVHVLEMNDPTISLRNEAIDVLDHFMNKLSEFDQSIYLLIDKLRSSGMYGKEYYDELERITKNTEFEKDILDMKSLLKDITTEPLENILDPEQNPFDMVRAEIVFERVQKLKDTVDFMKYVDMLYKKYFYMVGNDEIDEDEKVYMAQIFLRNFYK